MSLIITPRLYLQPATAAVLQAELTGPAALSAALGVAVGDGWPPELYDADAVRFTLAQVERSPGSERWWVHYCVLRTATAPTAIGVVGYKGPPAGGSVEIGYGILPAYRRCGYATEASRGLIAHAFATPGVERVLAETYPHLHASIAVMAKCGLQFVGAGSEPGVIRYELSRSAWAGRPPVAAG